MRIEIKNLSLDSFSMPISDPSSYLPALVNVYIRGDKVEFDLTGDEYMSQINEVDWHEILEHKDPKKLKLIITDEE